MDVKLLLVSSCCSGASETSSSSSEPEKEEEEEDGDGTSPTPAPALLRADQLSLLMQS